MEAQPTRRSLNLGLLQVLADDLLLLVLSKLSLQGISCLFWCVISRARWGFQIESGVLFAIK